MTEIQEKIIKYIKDNFEKTIKTEVSKNSLIKLKKPYTTPCMDKDFIDFYYWDTYFTDFIPAYLGTYGQIENNLDNFCDLIDKFGFIPNADHLTNRSQPPLFASAVYDYYKLKNDVSVIKKYINHVETEYSFWMKNRIEIFRMFRYNGRKGEKSERNRKKWLMQPVVDKLQTSIGG